MLSASPQFDMYMPNLAVRSAIAQLNWRAVEIDHQLAQGHHSIICGCMLHPYKMLDISDEHNYTYHSSKSNNYNSSTIGLSVSHTWMHVPCYANLQTYMKLHVF